MRRIFLSFAVLLACALVMAQEPLFIFNKPAGGGGCTTPTGTHYTESFGDSSTSCWTAGPSTCNHTYTVTGTAAQSIITSPAGAPANTACTNSLQMAIPDANEHIISNTFTSIPNSTSFDVTFTFYLSSQSVASGNSIELICFTDNGDSCDSSGRDFALFLANSSGTLTLVGQGTTTSTGVTITTATWYSVTLHHDSTSANCSLSVDGGAAKTFTCNANPVAEVYIGGQHSFAYAYTMVIGNMAF